MPGNYTVTAGIIVGAACVFLAVLLGLRARLHRKSPEAPARRWAAVAALLAVVAFATLLALDVLHHESVVVPVAGLVVALILAVNAFVRRSARPD
jgi:ABC-type xylose transport system permease subunit